ncbi:MAG: sigma-54 dependent transcriptional regulator [Planctomycetota bacterium]
MDATGRVLIVDDDEQVLSLIEDWMRDEGFEPTLGTNGVEALRLTEELRPDILLLDLAMPEMNGIEALRRIKDRDPDLPVVVISGSTDSRDAVEAMKNGASDFLTKPLQRAHIFRAVHRAMSERLLRSQIRTLRGRLGSTNLAEAMGPSEVVARLDTEVRRVAQSDFTVLIVGETGTGKELVATAIHDASDRRDRDFVAVDCGAVPEALFESELFGHEKGSFTDAHRSRPGRFEIASSGTLFLDEILNTPPACQAKFLRAMQERVIQRVGGDRPIPVDVRIVAAANQELEAEVAAGRFREDLYYRLSEFPIRIPPLRERRQDVLYLSQRFLDATRQELGKEVAGFSEAALDCLLDHTWPGNVRELRSAIRRAVLLAEDEILPRHLAHLGTPIETALETGEVREQVSVPAPVDAPLKEQVGRAVEAVERAAIGRALREAGGNKAQAARRLGIDYKTLYLKMKKYGLTVEDLPDPS